MNMRSGLGQAQERSAVETMAPPALLPATKEIPYDYVARFILLGLRGNRVQDVINISIEGAFVAVAIGYSFIPGPSSVILSGGVPPPPRPTIDFKYSIVDSGSGRELQNQPIHNIAGLGEATGERPFRPMAKPMIFMPRSTIRIEIDEISAGSPYTGAELQIVLQGYKMLGYGTAMR
ncbi:MAG: hypothetical protein ABI831_12405 [Betaproteobacteria bacterium]